MSLPSPSTSSLLGYELRLVASVDIFNDSGIVLSGVTAVRPGGSTRRLHHGGLVAPPLMGAK